MSAPNQYKNSIGPVTSSSDPSTQTRTRQGESQEQAALRLEKMEGAVRNLLECIGEDPGRDGLLDTPSRYAKALLFLTKGYHTNLEDIMHIGYIPSDTVIGLSKLPRIAEVFARRLQIQERLTKQVADAIMDILRPQGVAVVMESSHLCMVMRGVEKTSAMTLTSCMLGCFERENKARDEFIHFVGVNR
ncbi:gtp cyclohydrolase i [Fusarium flagelliforme]|uniref:GTP cyclohydrolase 1 n=1 Tax=Fusarium flagelliforme TaxID=2675880 RepID=A0A395MIU6_9HYPO|nr:gtp cyclohydrolase i [Fusarium flagelliforme]